MKLTKRQLIRIIKEEYTQLKREGLIIEARRPNRQFVTQIMDPGMMAEDMGMGFEEYIQPYVDLANQLRLTIEVNDYDNFQVKGSKSKILKFGAGSNTIEGGSSFNRAEFMEYGMWEV